MIIIIFYFSLVFILLEVFNSKMIDYYTVCRHRATVNENPSRHLSIPFALLSLHFICIYGGAPFFLILSAHACLMFQFRILKSASE
jgi:hypothetical protein